MNGFKKYYAELIGTLVLVFMGCGAAVVLGPQVGGGHLAVALSFGLSIVAMAYVIGPISGCHINPAVSLAMLITKKINWKEFCMYVIAQVVGATAGAAILYGIVKFGVDDLTGGLGTNGTSTIGVWGALTVEVVLTAIFVFTILGVTSDEKNASIAGLVIGLTLTFVHIVGIPLTGTSVNPARSIGPALFVQGPALANVWIFIVGPFVGATIAALLYMFLYHCKKEAQAKK